MLDAETVEGREARLNETALALIELGEGDLPAIVRFDAMLNAYLAEAGASGEDGSRVARAAELVAGIIIGESTLEQVLDPVAALLEEAMDVLDGPSSPAPPAADGSPSGERLPEDVELLPDFISESVEHLEAAESALLALEADPSDLESVNVVFRAFHTVKGTSGFLGLERVQGLAHHAESLLSRVRDGEIAFVGAVADLSLRASDLLRAVVLALRGQGPGAWVPLPAEYAHVLALLAAPDAVIAAGAVPTSAAPPAADEPGGDGGAAGPVGKRAAPETGAELSVRVRTDRLDRLVDLVGELVVAQAMVVQDPHVARAGGVELGRKIEQVGKIVRDLQDLSMALRMVPFRPVFQKIARVVRDVARKSGKEVDFVTEGEDTEIDRRMVDIIADPLVHMIRNAVDHGLELPGDRATAGKPARGTLRLAAYQQGGGVVVELSDDGRGLDRERILARAVEKGIVEPERTLSDAEAYALIFAPGFSTAETVTDLSGRGVGMDVVRRNVESLHGRIEIDSAPGRGTRFRMILPLTLAITDGMLIRVGKERYIVPTVSIERSLRPEPEALSSVYGKGEMVLLHGRVIPIVRLHEVFAVSGAVKDPTQALLMVIGEGTSRVALLVDELLGQQQFVAKPLGDGLGRVEGLAGGAVLGDGQVGLILDCSELTALARGRVGGEAARVA